MRKQRTLEVALVSAEQKPKKHRRSKGGVDQAIKVRQGRWRQSKQSRGSAMPDPAKQRGGDFKPRSDGAVRRTDKWRSAAMVSRATTVRWRGPRLVKEVNHRKGRGREIARR